MSGWEELRRLSDAATPGLWWAERGGWVQPEGIDEPVAKALGQPGAQKDADAAFIVAAVNYVRATLSGPTAPLDEAWREAEAALPEGNWGVRLEGTSGYGWRTEAWKAGPGGAAWSLTDPDDETDYPDPAAAFRALAARLAAASPDPAQGET
jgi:hypothetical protein